MMANTLFAQRKMLYFLRGFINTETEGISELAKMLRSLIGCRFRVRQRGGNMQKVVRTAKKGGASDVYLFSSLSNLLKQGYRVVLCNAIGDELEYIVEKGEENNEK